MHYLWFIEYLHIWNCFNDKNTCFHLKCTIFSYLLALSKSYKAKNKDFPGGIDWTPPANAEDTGLIPGLILHATEQLSPCATATEPVALGPSGHNYWGPGALPPTHCHCWALVLQLLSPCAWSLCSATREATAVRSPCIAMKSSPCSPQLEKAHTWWQRHSTVKN